MANTNNILSSIADFFVRTLYPNDSYRIMHYMNTMRFIEHHEYYAYFYLKNSQCVCFVKIFQV